MSVTVDRADLEVSPARTGSVAACLAAASLLMAACGSGSDQAAVPTGQTGQGEETEQSEVGETGQSEVGETGQSEVGETGQSVVEAEELPLESVGGDDQPSDGVGYEGADDGSGGELSFGDPTDDGFDEVINVDVEPEPTPASAEEILSRPDEVLPDVEEQIDPPAEGEEILDTVEVVDSAADVPSDRDGRTRNSAGELVVLDDHASLACAHAEVALSQLDVGNTSVAIERIWQAADQAGSSGVATVNDWQEPLAGIIAEGTADDVATLIGFLTVCTDGGYEL